MTITQYKLRKTLPCGADRRDAGGVDVTNETYEDCGHALFNSAGRLGTYNAESADLSWRRSLEFFDQIWIRSPRARL